MVGLNSPIFKMCFPKYKFPRDMPTFYFSNFYKGNDINYKEDVLFIDLRYGEYKIFESYATITKILKAKELLNILNEPY